jgi:hypothetical protein
MWDVGKGVTGGWQRKSQECLQGRVIVLEGSSVRRHPVEHQVCLEVDLFWTHGKIAS